MVARENTEKKAALEREERRWQQGREDRVVAMAAEKAVKDAREAERIAKEAKLDALEVERRAQHEEQVRVANE